MSVTDFLRSYWRVTLLVLLIVASVYALFVPGGVFADESGVVDENETETAGMTNLAYGLGLDGGTRIRAPVVGMTAESLEIQPNEQAELEGTLAAELDLDPADVIVRYDAQNQRATAEVFSDNVSRSEFATALQSAGVDAGESDIRDGVTQATRDEMIRTIETKINEAGLSGGRVTQSATLGGQYYIVVEVPEMSPSELRDLLSERGIVRVNAHYPNENGTQVNETVLEQDDFASVDPPAFDEQQGTHYVPVVVTEEKAPEYQQQMNQLGFTSPEGVGNCDIQGETRGTFDFDRGQPNYCLVTESDGEVVDAHSMGSRLASSMREETWANDPTFRMIVPTQEDAQQLSLNLRAGSLRAPLDFENDQTYTIQPALADQFKFYSVFIGVLAVITVSVVIYLRYADVRVAAPMIVTALSEVVILLGFAAAIELPLDLAHVAGFIAVIGTGVDDLVIIADEVMSEGDVNSGRVFDSRFRKAFWVIGAAAATTIIAMSPLAVLSLGDLRGFAIVTILGVLIGVLVTRPAYGDILRMLLTDR